MNHMIMKNLFLLVLLIGTAACSTYTRVDLVPGPGIPPDPGRWENNKTLLGIDSDNDGVRDDVQRYILALDIDHPFFKKALHEWAKVYQVVLRESDMSEKTLINMGLWNKATDCLWSATVKEQRNRTTTKDIKAVILNTPVRRKSYRKFWYNFNVWVRDEMGGSILMHSPKYAKDACSFSVDDFEGERWR